MRTTTAPVPTFMENIRVQFRRWRLRMGISLPLYVVRLGILTAAVMFFGLPLLWLFTAPTKTNNQLLELHPLAIGSVGYIFTAWEHLLSYNHGVIVNWIANSVWYVATGIVLNLVITIPAGYALDRKSTRLNSSHYS